MNMPPPAEINWVNVKLVHAALCSSAARQYKKTGTSFRKVPAPPKVTTLGTKKPIKWITRAPKLPAPKPVKHVEHLTYEQYKHNFAAMTPETFMNRATQMNDNVKRGVVPEQMIAAFDDVYAEKRAEYDSEQAIKRANARLPKPKILSEDEQKVEAGTHVWKCDNEKYGGRGQRTQVWYTVAKGSE